jgi:hypothetical protein
MKVRRSASAMKYIKGNWQSCGVGWIFWQVEAVMHFVGWRKDMLGAHPQ